MVVVYGLEGVREPYKINVRGLVDYLARNGDGVLRAYSDRVGRDPICEKPMIAHDASDELDAIMKVFGGLSRRYGVPFPRPLKSALQELSKRDPSLLTTFVEKAPRQLPIPNLSFIL